MHGFINFAAPAPHLSSSFSAAKLKKPFSFHDFLEFNRFIFNALPPVAATIVLTAVLFLNRDGWGRIVPIGQTKPDEKSPLNVILLAGKSALRRLAAPNKGFKRVGWHWL
jgi:hypothetical protein